MSAKVNTRAANWAFAAGYAALCGGSVALMLLVARYVAVFGGVISLMFFIANAERSGKPLGPRHHVSVSAHSNPGGQ